MAKLEINGRQVEVDDSFLSLPPEQQNSTVDEIAKSLGTMKEEKPSTAMDMLKSAGSGVAQGALDLVGLPGSIQNAFDSSVSAITGVTAPPPSQLSGEELRKTASNLTSGATDYKPQTTAGEYSHTAGAFVPGALLLGSGGPIARTIEGGIIPGLTSEAAGKTAEKYAPALEPYARVGGALVGGLIGPAARSLFPSANERAMREIGQAAKADNLTPEQMSQKLQDLGPEGMVADLGPNFQGQTGALANIPGPGNKIIRSALNDRNAGANARIAEAREPLGGAIVPSEVTAGIKQGQRDLGPMYREVFANAKAVDVQPIADALDSGAVSLRGPAQTAVKSVRQMLDIPGEGVLDPNPGALFEVRQAIDGMLKTETNDKVANALKPIRDQIDETLAASVPELKKVDAAYAELARQKKALVRGQTVLDSGRTAPRPSELATEVTDGALPKGEAIGPSAVPFRMSQGAAAEIDRILGNNTNDVAALSRLIKGEGDWNRSKLVSLFGEEKTNKLINVLDNEKTFQDTRNFATGNSLTANRLQYQKAYGSGDGGMTIPEFYGAGGVLGAIRGAGVKLAGKVSSALMNGRNAARNEALAKNLTGRQSVVDALMSAQTQGSRLAGPVKEALIQALLDQRRQQEGR